MARIFKIVRLTIRWQIFLFSSKDLNAIQFEDANENIKDLNFETTTPFHFCGKKIHRFFPTTYRKVIFDLEITKETYFKFRFLHGSMA